MELGEKLQLMRKQKGMTQEELAKRLYVSRTAISKWESGRGYPSIESLRMIADFFSVSVDELLSGDALLTLASEEEAREAARSRDLLLGLLDVCAALLLFLPFFAYGRGDSVQSVSLLSLHGVALYIRVAYLSAVALSVLLGVLTLALQGCSARLWLKSKVVASLALSVLSVLLFVIGMHPYAAVFAFVLLLLKVSFLLFRR